MRWSSLVSLAHLIGLALGVGSATVKLVLLLRCQADFTFVHTFLKVSRPITRLIIVGMILLTPGRRARMVLVVAQGRADVEST